MSDFLRNIFLWLAIAGTTFFVIQSLSGPATSSSMNYSEFVSLVNSDQVSSVEFKGDGYTLEGTLQDGSQFKTTRPVYVQDNQLMDDLFEHRVQVFGEEPQQESIWTQLLVASFPILIILSLIHISEPTRLRRISYAVFCLKKKISQFEGYSFHHFFF